MDRKIGRVAMPQNCFNCNHQSVGDEGVLCFACTVCLPMTDIWYCLAFLGVEIQPPLGDEAIKGWKEGIADRKGESDE